MWTYVQRTGNLYHNGDLAFTCYAGNGDGLNNPEMQNISRVGPLPCGMYTLTAPYHHPRLGPGTMNLEPDSENEMFGRSGFRFHGDNSKANHSASLGCICKSPIAQRLSVWNSGDRRVEVVAEEENVVKPTPLPV